MHLYLLSFIFATVLVAQLPVLPGLDLRMYLWLVLTLALLGLCYKRLRIFCCGVIGLLFAIGIAALGLEEKLAPELQNTELLVTGYITSLPANSSFSASSSSLPKRGYSKFLFQVVEVQHINALPGSFISADMDLPARISLSWYSAAVLPEAGEKWQLVVKLTRPHGSVNFGLFDYEGWLFAQGIVATGYVRSGKENVRLEVAGRRAIHHQIRAKIRQYVNTKLPASNIRGVLLALLIGESGQIEKNIWQILSATGTNHLLIISGLHVGLVAALVFALCSFLLRPFIARWRLASMLLTLLVTVAYGAIAGAGLPVQRALVMVGLAMLASTLQRPIRVSLVFIYALFLVTVLNPFAALNAGYWLSFGAVASLIFAFSGKIPLSESRVTKLIGLIKTQWVVFVAMAPILLCWVLQFSYISVAVNLFAIPVIGVIVIPILLVALPCILLDWQIGAWLLELVYMILELFIRVLSFFADLDWVWQRTGSGWAAIILACLGSWVLLSQRGLMPRWLAMVLFLPIFFPADKYVDTDLVVSVLDVGQGLSVLLKTRSHMVVYDTGPVFGERFDAGAQIVAPAIRRLGADRIESVVVSHGDLDHAGGFNGLLAELDVKYRLSSDAVYGEPCNKAGPWQLDQVKFSFLAGSVVTANENDKSCILLVETEAVAILLPGDIESASEAVLKTTRLPFIDLMIAPHHGSITSSSPGFLNHVRPQRVIISAGFRNRFNHPHPLVVQRYKDRGIPLLNTAESGQIILEIKQTAIKVHTARVDQAHFWYD